MIKIIKTLARILNWQRQAFEEFLNNLNKEVCMLSWSLAFFIIAIIAGIFGFTGIAVSAVEIAKILFFIFLVLFLVSILVALVR